MFISSTLDTFVFYLEIGLETLKKEQKFGKKFFKASFHFQMDLKNPQKQVRDETSQEDYPTYAVYFCKCRVVFLHSFIFDLFLYFIQAHP